MGTNFYVRTNECECCDRFDELHIGKSAAGWSFGFRAHPDMGITTWQDWKAFIADKTIADEYGKVVEVDKFVKLIETVKCPNEINKSRFDAIEYYSLFDHDMKWVDPEGFDFNAREFC